MVLGNLMCTIKNIGKFCGAQRKKSGGNIPTKQSDCKGEMKSVTREHLGQFTQGICKVRVYRQYASISYFL